ncbi:MAG TPA: AAA family ATPase, partial [bacterium]|nr:AAA family ATPase [bacterium]
MTNGVAELNERIREESEFIDALHSEISKVIVGQRYMIDRLLIALLTNGHILLEGVPGLAKTLTVNTLSRAIHTKFQRIQFTPDLLPADLLGTLIYNQKDGKFTTKKGPIFANIILADEINRSPAKVQSALLEAMQERQVTIGEQTFPLDDPFMVLATQNPIEQEGTYPLPEAQVDRFMLKVTVDYPSKVEEKEILRRAAHVDGQVQVSSVVTPESILKARQVVDDVYMDEKIEDYIIDLVFASRQPGEYGITELEPLIQYGGSPRASIYLALAAKANAFLHH